MRKTELLTSSRRSVSSLSDSGCGLVRRIAMMSSAFPITFEKYLSVRTRPRGVVGGLTTAVRTRGICRFEGFKTTFQSGAAAHRTKGRTNKQGWRPLSRPREHRARYFQPLDFRVKRAGKAGLV